MREKNKMTPPRVRQYNFGTAMKLAEHYSLLASLTNKSIVDYSKQCFQRPKDCIMSPKTFRALSNQ